MRQLLPIGIQDFAQLRQMGAVYVDKTALIEALVRGGRPYFLSRPRRFGKSLLVSTLDALFDGRADLFAGLAIEKTWDFGRRNPVVRISFGGGDYKQPNAVEQVLALELAAVARRHQLAVRAGPAWAAFKELLSELSARGSRPVVLIDEYDKPIVQVLEFGGAGGLLEQHRSALRAFFSVLKDAAPEFLLLTGVSRLARASVFSELNHLQDITWDPRYATLLGITPEELERDLGPALAEMAATRGVSNEELLARFTSEYDGFRFAPGAPRVFNPFSTLIALDQQQFGAYWTETGTPEFLVRVMTRQGIGVQDFDGLTIARAALASLDPLNPEPLPLLLQTGYLTILDGDDESLRLTFPNREVREGFLRHLLRVEANQGTAEVTTRAKRLSSTLVSQDLPAFVAELQGLFKTIPYGLDDATEKRYHSVFQAALALSFVPPGLVIGEAQTALGRADVVLDLPDTTWIFELKRYRPASTGIVQAQDRAYDAPWSGRTRPDGTPKPVRVVALTFGSAERNIVAWEEARSGDYS